MPFVKVQKTSAYFKRYQVKYRRRREGRTDYQARRALVKQDNDKYNAPKYRFVVRRTNRRIICQVAYATLQGDRIVAAADSTELARYGVPLGHTNYAAAYATGLLCARRLLTSLGLEKTFEGVGEATGEKYHVEEAAAAEERRPFKAALDVGLVRTTTGNRVFGAMKGACDGGMHIPHSEKRFPGFDAASGEYNAELHRVRIFGLHVAEYMQTLRDDEPAAYEARFSRFIKAGIKPEDFEEMYKSCHAKIRADPSRPKAEKKVVKNKREGNYIVTGSGVKYLRPRKLTASQRRERVQRKIALIAERTAAAEDDDAPKPVEDDDDDDADAADDE